MDTLVADNERVRRVHYAQGSNEMQRWMGQSYPRRRSGEEGKMKRQKWIVVKKHAPKHSADCTELLAEHKNQLPNMLQLRCKKCGYFVAFEKR